MPKGIYKNEFPEITRSCAICLENFGNGHYVTYLPCDPRHHFHTHCITLWLKHSQICPICKSEINERLVNTSLQYKEMVEFVHRKDTEEIFTTRSSIL